MKTFRSQILAAVTLLLAVTIISVTWTRPTHSAGGAVAVQVTSGSVSATDPDNAARQPVQFLLQPDTFFNTAANQAESDFPVPAGKRLVIEYVSAALGTGTGSVTLETTVGGTLVAYYFIENTGVHTHQYFPTHIYADPGTNVQVIVHSNVNGQRVYGDVEISGHYVNLP